MNLTQKAKDILSDFLKSINAPILIDATCGNGFDTLFLAQNAKSEGKVFAFDIQKSAILQTSKLLKENNLLDKVDIFEISHAHLKEKIPSEFFGKINVAMFNLGWLPKSDKTVITKPESTIKALQELSEIIDKANLISLLAYPAHDGGKSELDCVSEYLAKYSPQIFRDEANPKSPVLFVFSIPTC